MSDNRNDRLVWDMIVELRKEIVETQKLRTQILGFKITVVSALIGLISAINTQPLIYKMTSGKDSVTISNPDYFFVVMSFLLPAFTSVFFDFISNGCSLRIDRIGLYCRKVLEPKISEEVQFISSFPKWEKNLKLMEDTDFLDERSRKKSISSRIFLPDMIINKKCLPFKHPSYTGNILLTVTTILTAFLSIIWGIVKLSKDSSGWFFIVLIGIAFLFLIWTFMFNLHLYSRYYRRYHGETFIRKAKRESKEFELYELVDNVMEGSNEKVDEAIEALESPNSNEGSNHEREFIWNVQPESREWKFYNQVDDILKKPSDKGDDANEKVDEANKKVDEAIKKLKSLTDVESKR